MSATAQPSSDVRAPAGNAAAATVSPALVLAALVLAALNLRPALSSLSAELTDIRNELGLSGFAAGVLTTLPAACMGIFATLGAPLARRLGVERTLIGGLALIGLASAARGLGFGPAAFMVVTLAIGIGIAVVQALGPPIVKAFFARSPGSPTALFTAGLHGGAMLGAALTVPFTNLFGDWRAGLAVWGLVALPALVAWTFIGRRTRISLQDPNASGTFGVRDLDRGLTVRIMVVLAALALTFYVPLAWISATYEDAGYSESTAVLLLAIFVGMQAPGALLPALARTPRKRGRTLAVAMGVAALCLVAIGFATDTVPALPSAVLGFSSGGAFALALTLPVDHSENPAQAATLTGVAFTASYLIAATGPAVAGLLRDATGETALPLGIVGLGVLCIAPLAWRLASRHSH
ncbi:MAG TPA: MFS transporter [Solirubrobacterales bacterium]